MIIVSKLQPGTRLLIESNIGTIYALRVAGNGLMEVYSTDPIFKPGPPKLGGFVGSTHDKRAPHTPDRITKGDRMVLRFADAYFVTEPVATSV